MPQREISNPYEERLNFQDKEIADLTRQCDEYRKQRERDREHILELEEEHVAESQRAKQAMESVREKWKENKQQWKEGCDKLKRQNRLANLETQLAVYNSQLEVMRMEELLRQEGIAVLARDFRITEFQVKQQETEWVLRDLEGDKHILKKQNDRLLAQCAIFQAEISDEQEQSSVLSQEAESLKVALNDLRKDNQDLSKENRSSAITSQNLERLKLELDGAKGDNSTLGNQITELQRANNDLKRQVEKWKRLEEKEGHNAKVKNDLEVENKELEERIREQEAADKDSHRELKKLRGNVSKLEDKLAKSEVSLERTREELEESRSDLERAKTELKKVTREAAQLQASSMRTQRQKSRPKEHLEEEESEEEEALPNMETHSSTRPALSASQDPRLKQSSSQSSHRSLPVTRPRVAQEEDLDDTELQQDQVSRKRQTKGKGKAQSHGDSETNEDSEQGQSSPSPVKQKPRPRPRRRQPSPDEDDIPRKTSSSQTAKKRDLEEENSADTQPVKKAKRKLNVYPDGQSGFNWGSVQTGDGTLGIPTELSPIKEGVAVPKRSTSLLGRLTNHMW